MTLTNGQKRVARAEAGDAKTKAANEAHVLALDRAARADSEIDAANPAGEAS
jgi:hypothetical protein